MGNKFNRLGKIMHPPPNRIDGASVLYWAYAEVEPFYCIYDSNGELSDEIYGIAICKYENSTRIYRFSCNKDWETINDGLYDSIDETINSIINGIKLKELKWKKLPN